MTLVLTLATPRYVLQVSDRLVTRGGHKFDPASNKTVVYHAKNALVSIGYSGLAYLEDVPTDQWIAQKLRGEGRFLEPEPGRVADFAFRRAPRWLDIGSSIELLRRESAEVFSRLPAEVLTRHQVVVAGWQWRWRGCRTVARPILCEIGNSDEASGQRVFGATQVPRYWQWKRDVGFWLSYVPDTNPLSAQERNGLVQNVKNTSASPEPSQRLLVDAVRLAAQRSPVVGPDCMCVLIPPPGARAVHATYVSPRQARAVLTGWDKPLEFPATFTPWIVGPHVVVAPRIVVGSWAQRLGPFTVFMRGPDIPPGTGLRGASGGQPRPPDPPRSSG